MPSWLKVMFLNPISDYLGPTTISFLTVILSLMRVKNDQFCYKVLYNYGKKTKYKFLYFFLIFFPTQFSFRLRGIPDARSPDMEGFYCIRFVVYIYNSFSTLSLINKIIYNINN